MSNFRKIMINKLPDLDYLNDRPVFPEERRLADAFMKGNREAEREERNLIKEETKQKDKDYQETFKTMI